LPDGWRPRGLAFNEDKTRIVTLGEGFDFPGVTVRRYHGTLLIKPSKAAVRRIRERLRTEVRSRRGSSAQTVIARLNPIVRGWAACYRTAVSSQTFTALDHCLRKLTCKRARHSHPDKPARRIIRRSFGTYRPAPDGPGRIVTRRSRPHRVPGCPAAPGNTPPHRRGHPAALAVTARPLLMVRAAPPGRRPPAANPARAGTTAGGHPQGDNPQRHRQAGGRHPGPGQAPSPARSLLPALRPERKARQLLPATEPPGLARAETRGNSHVRFLGGRTQQCVRPTRPDRASARFALASVITAMTSPRKGFVRAFRSSFPRGP